jgi:MFS family permease
MKARHPRAALAAIFAEGFFGRLAFGMVSFAFPLYAVSLGLSLAQIGVLVSLRSLLALALKPVAGWLADTLGVRAVYILGALARTIAAGGLLLAGDFIGSDHGTQPSRAERCGARRCVAGSDHP